MRLVPCVVPSTVPMVAHAPRAVCGRCRRPTTVCYCAKLPELATRTRVVFLQHPRERDKAIGTARMAQLCLPNSELHVGVNWGDHAALQRTLNDPARPAALLYPRPGARNILVDPPTGPITLVVVDGTWSQAKTVVRDNPVLQALPHYAFAAPEPSQYRIRKEPSDEFVSTIEAVMYVLGVLEGEPARFRALLEPFRYMVDMQLAAQEARPARRSRQKLRPRIGPRPPAALLERYGDLVCVVGEANAWPYRALAPAAHPPDELVQWAAYRPSTGEVFEHLAAPRGLVSPSTSFHTELSDEAVRGAPPLDVLLAAFTRFARPTDVFLAWGHYGPELFAKGGGVVPELIDMRAVAQRLANRKFGNLEAAAATVGPPRAPLATGRAGRRLAALAQLLEHWRAAHSS